MNAIIFDCETNGLPKNWQAPMKALSNWPRVIELAWQGINLKTGEVWAKHAFLIKPAGWTIPAEKFWEDNGFNTEKSEAEGMDMRQVLGLFTLHAKTADVLVAHNMAFDFNVVGAEMIRYKATTGRSIPQYCTMKNTTAICKLPAKYGHKWPTLQELHRFLFNDDFTGAHAAGDDVAATAKCFAELYKRGLVPVPGLKKV